MRPKGSTKRRSGKSGAPHAVIASRIYAPEPAAAAFRLAAVAHAFVRHGIETTVLTSRYANEPATCRQGGVTVRRCPVLRDSSGYLRGYLPYLTFDIPLFFRLLTLPRGTVILTEPPPTTGMVSLVACRVRGLRYACFAADLWSEAVAETTAPPIVRRVVRWMETRAARGAIVTLAVSEDVAIRLREWGTASVVVGNGIDTETFSPTNAADRGEDAGPLLVYTGTASEVHGAGIFVEAMHTVIERHPRARLVFMGQGEDVPAMKEAALKLPLDATLFLPRQAPTVVAEWLNRADVALASVKPGNYGFAFPTKAYAAAACGTPVVFAGNGEPAAVIARGNLGRVAAHDAQAVADAIDAQLSDATWDGQAAREWVLQNASLRSVGERVVHAIQSAAAGQRDGRTHP